MLRRAVRDCHTPLPDSGGNPCIRYPFYRLRITPTQAITTGESAHQALITPRTPESHPKRNPYRRRATGSVPRNPVCIAVKLKSEISYLTIQILALSFASDRPLRLSASALNGLSAAIPAAHQSARTPWFARSPAPACNSAATLPSSAHSPSPPPAAPPAPVALPPATSTTTPRLMAALAPSRPCSLTAARNTRSTPAAQTARCTAATIESSPSALPQTPPRLSPAPPPGSPASPASSPP